MGERNEFRLLIHEEWHKPGVSYRIVVDSGKLAEISAKRLPDASQETESHNLQVFNDNGLWALIRQDLAELFGQEEGSDSVTEICHLIRKLGNALGVEICTRNMYSNRQ